MVEIQGRVAEMDTVLACMADGLVVYGPAGEIVRMNRAAETLLGYRRGERTKPLAERAAFHHIETLEGKPLPLEETPVVRALHGETVHSLGMALHRRDRTVWVMGSAAPVRSADGALLGAVCTFTDITALQQLQERREQKLTEVEHDRQRMGEAVRLIAHDVRQPLVAARGYAEYLRLSLDRGDMERVRKSAEAIELSTRRLEAMLRDLVDSAHLEAGRLQLNQQALELEPFARDALTRLSFALDVSRVRIEARRPVVAWADPDRLERILANLLSNAVKHSQSNAPVTVRLERSGRTAVVLVSDCGPGIDPQDLPHLFELGYRGTASRKVDGLGLGLYITHLLVEAHGGRIWVESAPQKGSSFYFTLPLAPRAPGTGRPRLLVGLSRVAWTVRRLFRGPQ